jgi:hypothetical protein
LAVAVVSSDASLFTITYGQLSREFFFLHPELLLLLLPVKLNLLLGLCCSCPV